MSNYTEAWLEHTCPACGGEISSSVVFKAMVISSGLLGMMMVAVLSLLVITYYQATLVERNGMKMCLPVMMLMIFQTKR